MPSAKILKNNQPDNNEYLRDPETVVSKYHFSLKETGLLGEMVDLRPKVFTMGPEKQNKSLRLTSKDKQPTPRGLQSKARQFEFQRDLKFEFQFEIQAICNGLK